MGKDLINEGVDTPQSGAVEAEARMADTRMVEVHSADLSPEMLISQAINKNVPVETMEKLLAMRRELKDEQAREAFFQDLAQFQAECPVIKKNKEVLNKPEYEKGGVEKKRTVRYHYAPLDEIVEQVKPFLQKFGFSYTIQTVFEKDPPAIVSILSVHHIEGHSRNSEFRVPIGSSEYMSEQQAHASASTFSKRYVFQNGFGILTGDEDNDAQPMNGNGKTYNHMDPPLVDGSAMKQLHDKILHDMSNKHFAEDIEFEGQQVNLDEVRRTVNAFLTTVPGPNLKQMTKAADKVARMLLIAEEIDKMDGVANEGQAQLSDEELNMTAEQLSRDDVSDIFGGKIVDTPETEGNLTDG